MTLPVGFPRHALAAAVAFITVCASSAPLAGAAAAPASERSIPVTVKDQAHDVHSFHKVKGLSLKDRNSIDIRRVKVSSARGGVRFDVRLGRLTSARRFDQMVFFSLDPAPGSAAKWSGTIGLSPQDARLAYAGLDPDGTGANYESCDPLTAVVLRRSNRVRLDVPNRCIPRGEVSISLVALTGFFRSDAGPWSEDKLKFPSPVVLR